MTMTEPGRCARCLTPVPPGQACYPCLADARVDAVQEILDADIKLRRAADLIGAKGYSRFAGPERYEPDGTGHSIVSAVFAVARDKADADALLLRVAGWLYITGMWHRDTPHQGVSGVVSDWETQAPGYAPDAFAVIGLLRSAAGMLTNYAADVAFPMKHGK